jgi:hypothetical protein
MRKTPFPRSRQGARRRGVDTPASPVSMTKASAPADILLYDFHRSSKDEYETGKAAGDPVFNLLVGKRPGDDFYGLGGMLSVRGEGIPVTGKLPIAGACFLESQKAKRGRPKNKMETKIARYLSVLKFRAQGCGVKQSRILAAQQIEPRIDAEAGERKYRLAEKEVLKSRVLKDFDGLLVCIDCWVMAKHKAAIVDAQADGIHLSGVFWIVTMGDTSAKRRKLDFFVAFDGSNRKTGGTIIADE